MSLQHLTLQQWSRRPARAALTIMSVAIAVTAVLGTSLAQSTVRSAYRQMSRELEGTPALEIVAAQGGRFNLDLLPDLKEISSVKAATPLVCRNTKVRVGGKGLGVLAVGLDAEREPAAWDQIRLTAGRPCREANEVVVAQNVAASLNFEVGARLLFLARRGWRSATVVGLAEPRSIRDLAQGATMVMPAQTLGPWFAIEGQVDRVRVLVDEAEDRDGIKHAIESLLPADLIVQAPVGQMVLAESMLRSTELALQFAGALSLAMATFIILNTLRMNFSERRRQLATLRALGATRGQISWVLMTEGLWIGIVGSLLGVPGGLGLAYLLGQAMQRMLVVELPAVSPRWEVILLALASGPLVSVVAAYIPAFQSRRISPVEQMNDGEPPRVDLFRRLAIGFAPVAGALSGVLLFLISVEVIVPEAAIPAFMLLLLAYISTLPLVVRPLVRLCHWSLASVLGVEGRLAAEQLVRRPTRTGLTAGVLVLAITSALGLGNAILNNVEDVRAWYRRSLSGDFFLRNPAAGDISQPGDQQTEVEIVAELSRQSIVGNVVTMRLPTVRVMDAPAKCIVRDFPANEELPWALDSPEQATELRKRLAAGEIVLASVLSRRLGLSTGNMVRLELRGRVVSLPIAAVVNDYNEGGMVAFLDPKAAAKELDLGPVEYYMVQRAVGADMSALEAAMKTIESERGLELTSFADLRTKLDQLINGIVVSLWSLLVLGFVVGGFAVANTLTMSVLEQTREFGLLRIVGMTRRQVRKMVLAEAALLGVVGFLMGTASGVATAFLIHACNEPLTGREVPFVFHYWLLAANAGACLFVALLSAWLPCRRATRLNLLHAIAYE